MRLWWQCMQPVLLGFQHCDSAIWSADNKKGGSETAAAWAGPWCGCAEHSCEMSHRLVEIWAILLKFCIDKPKKRNSNFNCDETQWNACSLHLTQGSLGNNTVICHSTQSITLHKFCYGPKLFGQSSYRISNSCLGRVVTEFLSILAKQLNTTKLDGVLNLN